MGARFFFTLAPAEELTGKNTMFGRIEGDTIYNLAKMGEAEVDEATERPIYPITITKIEILVNPFDGMKSQQRVAPQSQRTVVVERKKEEKGRQAAPEFWGRGR